MDFYSLNMEQAIFFLNYCFSLWIFANKYEVGTFLFSEFLVSYGFLQIKYLYKYRLKYQATICDSICLKLLCIC